ncbi:hypothetical protein GJ744_005280 [Endocarpon pusillum]|uniref:Exosome complex protein n=1 Tax=Endocarpon pusillum TaxID=364733 RepID=A0A8H7A7N6_9EURO|nr:hypothetical protein GJ744_005280 [Endocarpon pusillum]
MDATNLVSLVEHLEDNIDELEENLEPLLSAALTATTQKLPVLDKAKLYVLIVYSIESLLFSYLRLNGVKAKDHPVFKELTRVKQYFEKIKIAEEGPAQPRKNLSLNKQAAGRVIKHALSGNEKHDLERAEREAKEKLMAKRKLQVMNQKKDIEAETTLDTSEDESEEYDGEAEQGELKDTNTVPDTPKPLANPSNHKDKPGKKDIKKSKRKLKAERRATKRKRGQQDQGDQATKKKKAGKSKNKQDRSPPADRKWV